MRLMLKLGRISGSFSIGRMSSEVRPPSKASRVKARRVAFHYHLKSSKTTKNTVYFDYCSCHSFLRATKTSHSLLISHTHHQYAFQASYRTFTATRNHQLVLTMLDPRGRGIRRRTHPQHTAPPKTTRTSLRR